MWRRYDKLLYVSPQNLGDMMGCAWRTVGCTVEQIVDGTRRYTSTGYDSYQDDYGGLGSPDALMAEYFARQITSVNNGTPVIGLVDGATHAVVVTAGNYTKASNGLKQWDYVYVQDPLLGYGYRRFVAGTWMDSNIFQIISSVATTGWRDNYDTYGDETQVRGWRQWPPEGEWPPAY